MRKKEITREIAARSNVAQDLVAEIIDSFIHVLKRNFMASDRDKERYVVKGFGTLQRKNYISIKKGVRSIRKFQPADFE